MLPNISIIANVCSQTLVLNRGQPRDNRLAAQPESSGSGSDSDDEDDVASSSCKTAAPPRQGEQFSPSEAVEDSQGNATIGDSAELNEGEPMVVGAAPEAPEEEPTATGGAADSAKGKPKTTSGTTKGKPKAVGGPQKISLEYDHDV
ncbi:hypothetical protein VOLCADRAFT_105661 [Volvox carteri f. nagariensis]|uniref:Uncharacterized protein n=1 Tax=Volvox carteri f. nagariensis TaxID=3068 RepID=D8U268_VOLCA|nr:uncharacterized protein VOLCADRAFT_105661 [Volvox carteri f. nagariensis]EFJ46228.1 hypothetical protein VOLCADRAFT_105661 [Volvox carteri f. nagariensis]|eukprot:XP_002952675.1 hypothetical protein VOLCADRAFT_105661 [Volvox carteri f. nagariensis]